MKRRRPTLASIARRFDLALIARFGSRASDRATSGPDLDIAVLPSRHEAMGLLREAALVVALEAGVLDSRLAERFIASYVGLQDRIVHDYDTLDVGLTVRAAARLLRDAAEYGREVRRYLGAPGTKVTHGETDLDPPPRSRKNDGTP